jgi:hypothetical protein
MCYGTSTIDNSSDILQRVPAGGVSSVTANHMGTCVYKERAYRLLVGGRDFRICERQNGVPEDGKP